MVIQPIRDDSSSFAAITVGATTPAAVTAMKARRLRTTMMSLLIRQAELPSLHDLMRLPNARHHPRPRAVGCMPRLDRGGISASLTLERCGQSEDAFHQPRRNRKDRLGHVLEGPRPHPAAEHHHEEKR